jgi:hypothetical protein
MIIKYSYNYKSLTYNQMIKIYDNIFPQWLEAQGEQQFYRFPMEYNHYTREGNPAFFGRCLFNRRTGVNVEPPYFVTALCDYIRLELVPHMDPSAQFLGFERVIVNGQTGGMAPGRHTDFDHDPRYWTGVYFLEGQSGDLELYPESGVGTYQSFKSIDWRCSIAALSIKHWRHKQGDWRMTIGINWLMESQLQSYLIKC